MLLCASPQSTSITNMTQDSYPPSEGSQTRTDSRLSNYRLSFSADSWIVERRADPSHRLSKPEGRWNSVSFHNRLEHALAWLFDKLIKEADLQKVERFQELLSEALEEVEYIAAAYSKA